MPTLQAAETALIDHARAAPMLDQVLAWCALNSGTRNLAGLGAMAGLLAEAFAALPGAVTLEEPTPVDTVLADGTRAAIEHGKHLLVTVRPAAPLQLLFTGHMDTVYPADHSFQTVVWQAPGVLNGPGVADMKGGIALMLAALSALEASPFAEGLGYQVMIGSDEETGSLSSAALIEQVARGKLAAFTYEPTLPDGTLAGARGGTGNFSITIHGISAHAGRNPDDGRNAVLAAADLALRLAEARSPMLAVNPARIEGGGPNNVVPDLAILRVNFRPRDAAAIDAARAHLDASIAAVAAAHDVRIDCHGSFNRPPKPISPDSAKLFDVVRAAGADLGLSIGWRDTGGVCDGNNIAACGVPVVDTMGARGGAIHSPEEFLITDSLPERAALSALAIARIVQKGRL
jgi:glutamate carboxypeptidase